MSKLSRIAAGVIGVVVLLYGVFQIYSALAPSGPRVDRDKLAAAKAAAAAIVERFDGADPAGEPPRASDAAVAGDLAILFDATYVASLETLPIAEVQVMGEWTRLATDVGLGFLLWGTGKSTPQEITGDDTDRINTNTAEYRRELGSYFDFTLRSTTLAARSTAAHLAAMSDNEREQANVKSGSEKVRSGFNQTITGTLGLFEAVGLPDEWLMERLPALQGAKEVAATFLPAEMWRQTAAYAGELADNAQNPEIAAGLRAFAE